MSRESELFVRPRYIALIVLGLVLILSGTTVPSAAGDETSVSTATPIKHLVVVFDENISFDHYFGTYPKAANPPGEPRFIPLRLTPNVNGLTGPLLRRNPNLLNTRNDSGAANPFRLDRSQNLTADQNHGYTSEQQAFNFGLMGFS
jgi:phospholipase C